MCLLCWDDLQVFGGRVNAGAWVVWREDVLAPTACPAIVTPQVAGGAGASAVGADGWYSRTSVFPQLGQDPTSNLLSP